MKKLLGELLKEKGLLNEARLQVALRHQQVTGQLLGDILVRLGFVSAMDIAQTLAEQAGLEFIDVINYPISAEVLQKIPQSMAQRFSFIPIEFRNGRLLIGITNPGNVAAIDAVTRLTGSPPHVAVVDSESFNDVLERAYYFMENPIKEKLEKIISELKNQETASPQQVSSLVELILTEGMRRKATDIHISSSYDSVDVFYRIDGILQHGFCIPKIAQIPMISRIKVLSRLDITEQRLPQDGAFVFSFLDKNYEMRVSIVPTIYGENVVIRVLGFSGALLRLGNLGFQTEDIKKLKILFSKPHGMIIVAGPTGSGKTTTIYAAMREINLLERNVLSIEDPVEYRMSFVRQVQVNEKIGLDFIMAGRNFMRQDPDVIFLGEIRDEETAKIAIRASITGHLVLSTLHTNDAVTAVPRLIDLGIDRFLLSSSILGVIAQRLVRLLCPKCKVEKPLTPDMLSVLIGQTTDPLLKEEIKETRKLFAPAGCEFCHHTGYTGRTAIGEVIIFDDELREMIASGMPVTSMKDAARKKGTTFMRDDGIRKVLRGLTSLEELTRVAG
ncbi:MAG: GspE/PulE family protein [Thermodesulfovibrionales bacterium]|nr:GspE/PulE family protein [Thermodesulfovibrionales bacterium]